MLPDLTIEIMTVLWTILAVLYFVVCQVLLFSRLKKLDRYLEEKQEDSGGRYPDEDVVK